MNISLEHNIQYEHRRYAYWIRIKLYGGSDKKSTLLVLASKNYLMKHYADTKEITNEHTASWIRDVIKDLEATSENEFAINQVYRKVYAYTFLGWKNGMDFLEQVK